MKIDLRAMILPAVLLAGTAAVIAFGAEWLDLVERLEMGPIETLPDPDAKGDYLAGVTWAGLLTIVVTLWGSAVRFRAPLMAAWTAKVLICLTVMLFYDYTYGVDPDGYFGHASSLGFNWQGLELGQGTANTRTLAWLHFRWLSTSFNATRLSFALLGLAGAYLIYRAGTMCLGRSDPRVFLAFALMPSILFWSSILGKDPVVFFGIAAYAYGVVGWHTSGRARYVPWVVIGLVVAVYIRMWFGPILLIPLALLGMLRSSSAVKRTAFVMLGAVGLALAPTVLQYSIGVDVAQQGELLEATDSLSRSFGQTGSSQDVPELATLTQLTAFAPLGVLTALFRPLPGEVMNLFGLLTGLENAFLVVLAMRAVWRTRLRDLKEPLVAWALSAVLIWAGVYSIAAFQNLGTLSRYKLQIMPLFLGLLLYLGRRRGPVVVPSRTAIEPKPTRPTLRLVTGAES